MKKNTLIVVTVSMLGLALLAYASYGFLDKNEDLSFKRGFGQRGSGPGLGQDKPVQVEEYIVDESDFVNSVTLLKEIEVSTELSEDEKSGLLLMREEEKLARDVYLALADTWGVQVFSNIAASEATHMAAVGDLINRYGLIDPIVVDTRGVFVNPDLQKLYNDLVDRGSISAEEAFKVGAIIEDLDIADLERLIGETDKNDIKVVYENLQKGSRNHLRAFTRQLERLGDSYTPIYISAEEYEAIIGSGQERGRM